jgi:hypothetical protein
MQVLPPPPFASGVSVNGKIPPVGNIYVPKEVLNMWTSVRKGAKILRIRYPGSYISNGHKQAHADAFPTRVTLWTAVLAAILADGFRRSVSC